MSTLERINAEHRVIAAIMNVLEAEVNALEEKGEFDIDLVRLIIRYMEEYPDRFHHPKEELLFDAAASRDPEFRERVSAIRSQHRALPGLTSGVKAIIDAIDFGESRPRGEVLRTLRAYIDNERSHIVSESGSLFPELDDILSPEDWELADQRVAQLEDPLTGGADPGPYKRLQALILARE